MINPNDHEDMAERIKEGLEMPEDEQRRRMQSMRSRVALYDVKAWAADFMKQLAAVKVRQHEYDVNFLDHLGRAEIAERYRDAGKRLLLLDYDGTLVPFSPVPAEATPGGPLLELLENLCRSARNDVYIISGRDSNTLQKWLGHLPVHIVAEHGAKVRRKGGEWNNHISSDQGWKPEVEKIMNNYVQRCAHSFVEMKDYSMAWHYRNSNAQQGRLRSAELYAELLGHIRHRDLHILNGNKVIEVRNQGIDKGAAVRKITANADYDFIMAIGDDTTDEDMFQALGSRTDAYTFRIGNQVSFARYNLHTSQTAISLLEMISNLQTMRPDTDVAAEHNRFTFPEQFDTLPSN
jgi:trehalose 6-phosphate synthase/phosphatase